jgi:hypothetical protein
MIMEKQIKKDDIFYTSWGYDQTNYDYIIVVSVSKSGKTVKCRRTSCKTLGYSAQSHIQKPINEPFGEVFQMRVSDWNNAPYLRGSYPFLHTGEGSKRLDGFSRAVENDKFHETDSMFGH